VRVLRHPEFLAGATDTGFLTRHALTDEPADHDRLRRHAVAAALASAAERRAAAPVQPLVPSGWRNVAAMPQVVAFTAGDEHLEVRYRGHAVEGVDRVWSATPTEVDLTIDGVRRRVAVERIGPVSYVDDDSGSSVLTEVERFPLPDAAVAAGSLLAPLPGSVVRVLVEAGDAVTRGQTLVVLEAMKMEHSIQSPADGTVTELPVQVGQQVATGEVLAVVVE
jgi:propionyl-CoA carboxylase alpha chain